MQSFLAALGQAVDDAFQSLGYVVGRIPTVLAAILVVLLFARLAQTVVGLADRAGRISPRLDPSLKLLIRQLISAGIIIFGVTVGFSLLGLNLTTIAATFGVAGLIVGFALKDMLENFIAGVLILWRRPFEIADHIKVGDETGMVRDINFRTTTLQTLDGVEVLIPNAQLFSKAVYNFTHYGSRRTTIIFKVPLSTDSVLGMDLEAAQRQILGSVDGIEGVLQQPSPEVLLLGGSLDGYELHLRYWTSADFLLANRIESAIRSNAAASFAAGKWRGTDVSAAANGDDAAHQGTSVTSKTSSR